MPKQIKVSDEIYARLKAEADKNYRSMGGQIEFLMSGNTPVPENTPYQNPGGTAPSGDVSDLVKKSEPSAVVTRGKGDILADIRETEADRDEELRNCQDPETSRVIMNNYVGRIDGLWKEYHANTNA